MVSFDSSVTVLSDPDATIIEFDSLDCSSPSSSVPGVHELKEFGNGGRLDMSFLAVRGDARSACLWVRWRAQDAVPTLSIDGLSGSETVSVGTIVTASVVGIEPGWANVLFFNDANCAGNPLYEAPGFLKIVSYQHGFTGSFQAIYTDITEDYGETTISGYVGPCIPVT